MTHTGRSPENPSQSTAHNRALASRRGKTTVMQRHYLEPEREQAQPEAIRTLQLNKLKALLEKTWNVNPFYRDHWKAAGIRPERINSLDDFRERIPSVEKQDFLDDQLAVPPTDDAWNTRFRQASRWSYATPAALPGRDRRCMRKPPQSSKQPSGCTLMDFAGRVSDAAKVCF